MPHRISDEPILLANGTTLYRYGNITSLSPILHHHPPSPHSRGLSDFFIGERDDPDLGFYDSFKEGYTRPGGKELVMVLVTGMLAASVSGAVLGSFVSALVVLSRRLRINPDNITTPLAACLSDLVTLFCLGLIGSFLVPYIDTALPIVTLPCLVLVGAVFTWYTLRNDYVKDQIRSGWTPLFAAMTISSAVGVVLERCVSRYEGYAILAVAMTGEPTFEPCLTIPIEDELDAHPLIQFVPVQASREPSDLFTPLASPPFSTPPMSPPLTHPIPHQTRQLLLEQCPSLSSPSPSPSNSSSSSSSPSQAGCGWNGNSSAVSSLSLA
jgi:hypothetical protein